MKINVKNLLTGETKSLDGVSRIEIDSKNKLLLLSLPNRRYTTVDLLRGQKSVIID